jgi:serine/threonine protein kinase
MTDAERDPVPPGTTLGVYRIERVLGRGGMGIVYLAYDTTLHRQVALKVVIGSGQSGASRATVLREARNAAALNNSNICTVYEVGEAEGAAFIAMEYVEGTSLRDRLDRGALPMDEAIRYAIQAAEALAYAHERGVVHRDFKAANVIVTGDERLKVVDFGLAQRRDAAIAAATTLSLVPAGSLAGTPYAMAPEQVRGETADARTDIWALGVLVHEMVTGSRPFDAPTVPELFSSILRDSPKPLSNDVPAGLRTVVGRCLEKARDRRYSTAGEVRAALDLLLQTAASAQRPASLQRPSRVGWLVAASLVAIGAVLVGFNIGGVRDRGIGNSFATGPISLALLPLDSDQADLSDGFTEQLAVALSRVQPSRLSVVSRASSMQYRSTRKPAEQIGRELSADAILTGSVRRSGDRVRIALELVQVSNARTIWREAYDRSTTDLVALERGISGDVAKAVGIQAAAGEVASPANRVNPEAYDLYLRGLSRALRSNEPDLDLAIPLLEKAVALDPGFVPAHAYLAFAYGTKSSTFRPTEPQWEEKAFVAVRRTLELDANSPEANYAKAILLWRPSYAFPSREALQALRKAVAARPDFDEAWHQHGFILMHVGHVGAAMRDIERAVTLNPGNTTARFRFAPIYNYQQQFESALTTLDRVPLASFPAQWTYQRAWALISLNRLDEAGRFLEAAIKENPVDQGGVMHAARGMVRIKRGDRQGAEADIADAIRLGRSFLHFHHTAYSIGAIYATMGNYDEAGVDRACGE